MIDNSAARSGDFARICGLLTKTSSGAYAAETAKIPGNGTRSSLFYSVQKFPLNPFLPRSPPPGLTARSPGRRFRDEFAADSLLQRRVVQTIGSWQASSASDGG